MRGTPAAALTVVTVVRRAVGTSLTTCGRPRSTARRRGFSSATGRMTGGRLMTGGAGSAGGFIVSPVVIGTTCGGDDR